MTPEGPAAERSVPARSRTTPLAKLSVRVRRFRVRSGRRLNGLPKRPAAPPAAASCPSRLSAPCSSSLISRAGGCRPPFLAFPPPGRLRFRQRLAGQHLVARCRIVNYGGHDGGSFHQIARLQMVVHVGGGVMRLARII